MVLGTTVVVCSIDVIAHSELEALGIAEEASDFRWEFNTSRPEGQITVDCIGREDAVDDEDAEMGVV